MTADEQAGAVMLLRDMLAQLERVAPLPSSILLRDRVRAFLAKVDILA